MAEPEVTTAEPQRAGGHKLSIGVGRLKVGTVTVPSGMHTFDAFQHNSFRLLFAALSCAGGGYFLQQVVIGWLIYDVTESPFITSVVASLEAVPLLIMSPFGGFMVDSMDRRKILAAIYVYQGSLALALGVGVMAGYVGSAQIITFMLIVGFAWTVNEPAISSIIANTVPREGLLNAFALANLGRASTRLAIPALGGLMIETLGGESTLFAEAFLFYGGAAVVLFMRPQVSKGDRPRPSEVIAGLIEGAKYVKGHRDVLGLLVMQFAAPLFMYPFVAALLPVYAAEVYDVGAGGLGLLLATGGVGMVIGTFFLATLGNVKRKGMIIIFAIVLSVVSMVAVSLTPWLVAGLLILTAFNAAHGFFYTATNGAIQSIIPDNMRGRIAGLSMATWGGFPVTALLAGAVAEKWGVQTATFVGACILTVYLVILLRVFRSLWRLE